MYTIKFSNLCEIRMGSPFNVADIDIVGDYIPDLDGFQFQDKAIIFMDGTKCILVQWDTLNNEPGFILWYLDEKTKEVSKTKRFKGCCNDIKIEGNKVIIIIWSFDSVKGNEEALIYEMESLPFGNR